jgi:cytochrome P450/NADPH-cytochrome P450 reductase
MMDGKFEALPPNSWKPFGHGMRACIGRAFAIQEAILAVATIIQNFDLELADPHYEMKVKFTLTIKPENLMVKMKSRRLGPAMLPLQTMQTPGKHANGAKGTNKQSAASPVPVSANQSMLILYGSNSGSCEALAMEL